MGAGYSCRLGLPEQPGSLSHQKDETRSLNWNWKASKLGELFLFSELAQQYKKKETKAPNYIQQNESISF